MLVINLMGGPGSGKSTTAADLFVAMKKRHLKVELVTEYAKDMCWERRDNVLQDQLYILAKQNRRLARLADHGIDYVVTDSPLPTGLLYTPDSYYKNFSRLLMEVFNSYTNVTFHLKRNHPYDPVGRNQTEEEAQAVDHDLSLLLCEHLIPHTTMTVDDTITDRILAEVLPDYDHHPHRRKLPWQSWPWWLGGGLGR